MFDVFVKLWNDAVVIWSAGGWAMWALLVIALVMFAMGIIVHQNLLAKRDRVPERVWRRWIERPRERTGHIGELLDITLAGDSLQDTVQAFRQVRASEMAPFERDLKVMKVCVSTAPLVGLLGTVTGMLATFGALATGSGGDQTMSMISAGISEALITTETGLVVALPGLFFQYQLARRVERYKAFLAHLESVYAQVLYRDLHGDAQVPLVADLPDADRPRIRRILLQRLRHAAGGRQAATA